MDSVFTTTKPGDDFLDNNINNNNSHFTSRQSTSSPLLSQSISMVADNEENDLCDSLDELKKGFPQSDESSSVSLENFNGIENESSTDVFYEQDSGKPEESMSSLSPPVPKARVHRPSEGEVFHQETVQSAPIPPVKKPRPSTQNSINESDIIPDDAPPPLPKKLTRKHSYDT